MDLEYRDQRGWELDLDKFPLNLSERPPVFSSTPFTFFGFFIGKVTGSCPCTIERDNKFAPVKKGKPQSLPSPG